MEAYYKLYEDPVKKDVKVVEVFFIVTVHSKKSPVIWIKAPLPQKESILSLEEYLREYTNQVRVGEISLDMQNISVFEKEMTFVEIDDIQKLTAKLVESDWIIDKEGIKIHVERLWRFARHAASFNVEIRHATSLEVESWEKLTPMV